MVFGADISLMWTEFDQARVVECLQQNPKMSQEEIAHRTGIRPKVVEVILVLLRQKHGQP